MSETRLAADLRLDVEVPGLVGFKNHKLSDVTLVFAVIVDTGIDPSPHLGLLLTGYRAGWNLASHHVANPGGTRHGSRAIAAPGLSEMIRAAYTDAFYAGYDDRQRVATSEALAEVPLDPFVLTATEREAVEVIARYLR